MQGDSALKIENAEIDYEEKNLRVQMKSTRYLQYDDVKNYADSVKSKFSHIPVRTVYSCEQTFAELIMSKGGAEYLWKGILQYLKDTDKALWAIISKSEIKENGGALEIIIPQCRCASFYRYKGNQKILDYLHEVFKEDVPVIFTNDGGDFGTVEYADEAERIIVGVTEDEYNKAMEAGKKKRVQKDYAKGYNKVYGSGSRNEYKGKGSSKKRTLTPKEGEELKKDQNGNVIIFGGPIDEPVTKMIDLTQDSGYVAIEGEIFAAENKEIPSGSFIESILMTDGTYSVMVKFFFDPEDKPFVEQYFKPGKRYCVFGDATYDKFSKELAVRAFRIVERKKHFREDHAEKKRVELHLHTNMSAQDALTRPEELIPLLVKWGHTAVAITDHGVAQAYPDMINAVKKSKADIKLIYGIECYLTDQKGKVDKEEAKKYPRYHCIILVQNMTGLKNLYKLISKSNLDYFYKRPVMPRFEIEAMREGLIIGSACSEGELYQAILAGKSDQELLDMASFYDYLEIQPTGNDQYLIRRGNVANNRELQQICKKIISLGDALGKMTVATSDVHFLNPEDAIYRNIMQGAMGYEDADLQPPLYLKTTEEMLNEFEFLDDRAYEVVVENTNKIADMLETINPLPKGEFYPVLEGSNEKIRESSYCKMHELYGENVPEHIVARLDRELDSIINHGYSVMYLTAKELVAESARNGYSVGSRGSVGSSLAAFMSGITEVNSLPPHYRCPKCFYNEFFMNQEYESGCDMPQKNCPDCGEPLIRDGFDIPFETFLGFDGDKVPDIDLNFAPDDQPNAHRYTGVLFGNDKVFRAGTISGLAEKNARGYVLKYLEKHGRTASEAEINRLASGFVGVRKTTGQHPGGIMVLPRDKEIYDFTPIQHPADDPDSDTVTTHFDYHFLHDTILKLDILGHDGPQMLKYLEDFTGTKSVSIDVADSSVLSLFTGTDALRINPSRQKKEIVLGTLGIPEFGTSFAMQMLLDTKPTTVSELVRIAGLSHGTDVWTGNAQVLIQEGTCTLSQAICCRDDIMLYLIKMGLEKKESFTIMESVRKGKGLKPEWEEDMRAHDVPEWYITSCKKIKYMFPRAHAVAYVILSLRIAWYKIYHPIAYYCTRFSLKIDEFDGANMLHGETAAFAKMNEMSKTEKRTDKDERQLKLYEQLLEMYARDFDFLPVDIYKSDAKVFRPEDGMIRPPLACLQGVGVNAAEAIVAGRNDGNGEFYSVADFVERTGANKTVVEALRAENCFAGLPEDNRLSFFDTLE